MIFDYLIIAFVFFLTVKSIFKTIKTKKYRELLRCLAFVPFQFFFFVSIILGGSAFNDAATEYESYQAGHYYLVNHGQWTEVSYGVYNFVLISEIVGISTFVIAFLWALVSVFTIEKE